MAFIAEEIPEEAKENLPFKVVTTLDGSKTICYGNGRLIKTEMLILF